MDNPTPNRSVTDSDGRPGLAIIANCLPPYRVNLHLHFVDRIPELRVHTLISHGDADFGWSLDVPESIHTNYFGGENDSPFASRPLRSPLREWRKGARLIEYLHAHDVRAVICTGYQYISYQRVIYHCRRAGIPLFFRCDSNITSDRGLPPFKQWIKQQIYRSWIGRVTGVMSMGEFGDQFVLKYGANPQRIYRVPYMPDYDFFARVDSNKLRDFRRRFALTEDRKYLVYSGRLVPVKRVDLLIDAFASIADERPNWDLMIVGNGPLEDDLRRRVPERLRNRIVWIGFLEQPECALAYHAAEALVLPSEREPWGVVVQEAMAAGLPVIASDIVGASHEMVEDKVSGRIFAAGDLPALTQALRDVTDESSSPRYKVQSQHALTKWRAKIDPVEEVRRALVDAKVLANGSEVRPESNA